MADVQVTDIDVMKAYGGKLRDMRDVSVDGGLWIRHQISKIKEDYNRVLSDMHRMQQSAESDCRYIQERYRRAIDLCGREARPIIGNSDIEAKHKLDELQMRVELVQNSVKMLQAKLESARIKTLNYMSQMDSIGTNCINLINKQVEVLQKYKDYKK
jgi:hypothetical protein